MTQIPPLPAKAHPFTNAEKLWIIRNAKWANVHADMLVAFTFGQVYIMEYPLRVRVPAGRREVPWPWHNCEVCGHNIECVPHCWWWPKSATDMARLTGGTHTPRAMRS